MVLLASWTVTRIDRPSPSRVVVVLTLLVEVIGAVTVEAGLAELSS
jgi:hypothetical protein